MVETLVGKFHAHITVHTDKEFECPKGWKTTIILLKKDGREQKDVMITRHFVLGSEKNPNLESIMNELHDTRKGLWGVGHNVIRVKLEHESLPTLSPTEITYRECHIKIKKPTETNLITVDGFVESSNPMEVTTTHSTVFLNARFYQGSVDNIDCAIDKVVEQLKALNPKCEILETKKETTVYDTNHGLDKWWA